MTSETKTWESIKAEYLRKVEKALSSVKSPRTKEVLEDVRFHLERRFAELEPDKQTRENLQAIITEMGPASDYAELLDPEAVPPKQSVTRKLVLAAGVAVVIAAAAIILLPRMISPKRADKFHIPPTSTIKSGRIVDKVDYPFANDPRVVGAWRTVDFVGTIKDFKPARRNHKGKLWLNHLVFKPHGDIAGGIFTWTKGLLLNYRGRTASAYEIKEIDDSEYLFFEWKSGDYTIRHKRPGYYVLKRVSPDSVRLEPIFGEKAQIPPTSVVDDNGHIIDKIDYPFVNAPEAIGSWESVDFVKNIEDFKPENRNWAGDLFLKELVILENGRTNHAWTWTRGLLLSRPDKTASKYLIEEVHGTKYMFLEWKSGDYVIRRTKPSYYVLKKAEGRPHVESRTTDKIDYPFVCDRQVIGTWKSVDFVEEPQDFQPGRRRWKAGPLFLKQLVILPDGKTANPRQTWTKGLILNSSSKTASRYKLQELNGSTYMFFEWKSGDYTFRRMKPKYYVLRKEESKAS